jgi:hypothetical protein
MEYTSVPPQNLLIYWKHGGEHLTQIFDTDTEAFKYVEVTDPLEIGGSFPESLRITDSKFDSVHTVDCTFEKSITFRDCIFEGDFIINEGNFKSRLHFLNCEFHGNFVIRNGFFNTLLFDNSKTLKQAKIVGGVFESFVYSSVDEKTIFQIEGRFTFIKEIKLISVLGMTFFAKEGVVNYLWIEGYYNSSSRINFSDIKCNSVKIEDVNNDGKIYFSNFNYCQVTALNPVPLTSIQTYPDKSDEEESLHHEIQKNLKLNDNISLYNYFFFNSLRKELLYESTRAKTFVFDTTPRTKPLFSIINCSLGILELRDIPLENMGVEVLSSDLSLVKLINTTFPLQIKSFNSLNEYYVYNDIYTSANRQNNFRDKINYYRVSQQALLKNIISEGRFTAFPSYISIVVSKYASNHGSNWGRALIVTLLLGLIMYGLFVISFSDISFDLSIDGFMYFSQTILPYLPQFFNPLHKMEFMEKVSTNFGVFTGLTDILGRLFISIGIFELVRSFRKFVRT